MFGTNYYFGLTRKFVTVFGTLFNDITITRPYTEDSIDKIKSVKVPLTYASLDKLLARVESDPDLDRQAAAISPAMSFEVGSPVFDPERNLQSTMQRRYMSQNGPQSQFVGVPYNLDFKLYIYANQEEDGLRVLENIIPYFTPSLSVTIKLVPEMNYSIDVPITLNSIEFENRSFGSMIERRALIWTLNFVMKTTFVGPITSDRKVIRVVYNNIYDIDNRQLMETVRTQPGLTANGEATSNINETIDYMDIEATDDFGFIHQIIPGDEQ